MDVVRRQRCEAKDRDGKQCTSEPVLRALKKVNIYFAALTLFLLTLPSLKNRTVTTTLSRAVVGERVSERGIVCARSHPTSKIDW
jgi:hypothetical protein